LRRVEFIVRNYDPSINYSFTPATGFTVAWVNQDLGLAEVTGMSPGETASVTVVASNGSTSSSSLFSGTSLRTGVAPAFGAVTSREEGFSVPITNYDSGAVYTVTSGSGSVENGVLIVTNVPGGSSGSVTLQVAKSGYEFASRTVSGLALVATTTTTTTSTTVPVATTTVASSNGGTTPAVTPMVISYSLKAGRTALLKSIAARFKFSVPTRSKLTAVVVSSSKRYCSVVRTSLKGLRSGSCRLTLVVTPLKGKTTRKTVIVKVT